jgi:uncharacterized RmlC-like cupin family protein
MSTDTNKSTGRTAVLVRPGETYQGKQGLTYGVGVFAQNAGATGLCNAHAVYPTRWSRQGARPRRT